MSLIKHLISPALRSTLSLLTLTAVAMTPAFASSGTHSFDVDDGGLLEVDADLGSIVVEAGGSGNVTVTIDAPEDDDLSFDVRQGRSGVRVVGEYKGNSSGWFGWGGKRPKVEYRITVPKNYNVDLDTKGGSISVDDLRGRVDADTSGGSLSFGNIDGPVDGNTSGGSIRLESSNGDANLDTSGGSIKIGDVQGNVNADTSGGSISIARAHGNVVADTSGGSISVEEVYGSIDASTSGGHIKAMILEQPGGDCRLSTSGGSVHVTLAEGIHVDLDASTSGGRATSDFPLDNERRSKTHLSGQLNGGGPKLVLRSSGGGVHVKRR